MKSTLSILTFAFLILASPVSTPQEPAPATTPPALTLFAVQIRTGEKWDASKPPGDQLHFRDHSANLKRQRDAGHLITGARYSDIGLVVLAAESEAQARAMLDADPSFAAGVFRYEVHPMNVFYAGSLRAPSRDSAVASASPGSNGAQVRNYLAAFNSRQIDTMMNMVTDDIQWLSVAGDKITVETQGKASLRASLEAYFKSTPSARSELEWVQASASRVTVLERAGWQGKSGPKSQASLAVYEFKDGLISRVYYYPAEP